MEFTEKNELLKVLKNRCINWFAKIFKGLKSTIKEISEKLRRMENFKNSF